MGNPAQSASTFSGSYPIPLPSLPALPAHLICLPKPHWVASQLVFSIEGSWGKLLKDVVCPHSISTHLGRMAGSELGKALLGLGLCHIFFFF